MYRKNYHKTEYATECISKKDVSFSRSARPTVEPDLTLNVTIFMSINGLK